MPANRLPTHERGVAHEWLAAEASEGVWLKRGLLCSKRHCPTLPIVNSNDSEGVQVMTTSMVVIGLDPHKASNTIAVLEADETLVTRRRFDNTPEGMTAMLDTVAEHPLRVWAVEGANGIGRSIAQRLVAADED